MNFVSAVRENVFECTRILLKELGVPISVYSLRDRLIQHPDYPSMNSITETLCSVGVANVGIRGNIEDISSYPRPFIVPLRQKNGNGTDFTVVKDIRDNQDNTPNIVFLNPNTLKWTEESLDVFKNQWQDSTVLLIDASECHYEEKNYVENQRKEHLENTAKYLPFIIVFLAVVLMSIDFLHIKGSSAFPYITHVALTFMGIIVTSGIVMYELGHNLPGAQELCGMGKKMSCDAVLNSDQGKFFGIGWGEIGFTYFTGNLLFVVFSGNNNPFTFFLLAWLNMFALPYTFFSVYYQWKVVKQWCPLCLAVQGLIMGQFLLSVLNNWETLPIIKFIEIWRSVPWFVLSYLVAATTLLIILPHYKNYTRYRHGNNQFGKLIRNPSILQEMLSSEIPIKGNVENLGIKLGSKTAKHIITKVCNPYCSPCAKTHKILEDILSGNDNISLRIIFTATQNPMDYRNGIVSHLLSLEDTLDNDRLTQALNDWYSSPKKDYALFAQRYPIEESVLSSQIKKIGLMDDWCKANNIKVTPTIYLDDHLLPESINLKQIQYI